jgi:hypothetical protein
MVAAATAVPARISDGGGPGEDGKSEPRGNVEHRFHHHLGLTMARAR